MSHTPYVAAFTLQVVHLLQVLVEVRMVPAYPPMHAQEVAPWPDVLFSGHLVQLLGTSRATKVPLGHCVQLDREVIPEPDW